MYIAVEIQVKEEPTACSKCPFYRNRPYTCHNERGTEAHCFLGYMTGDMRDSDYLKNPHLVNTKYPGCRLEYKILEP